jgi:hypothetical protein
MLILDPSITHIILKAVCGLPKKLPISNIGKQNNKTSLGGVIIQPSTF